MYTIIGIGGIELIFLLFALSSILLTIIALVDVLRSEFRGQNDKLIWIIVILFSNVLGSLLYFFIGRNQRIVWNFYSCQSACC